jgi:hypothetical protein
VAWQAFADDHAGLRIECGEQRGRAVALVIIGHHAEGVFPTRGGGAALPERQPGPGPVKRLNLRRLFHARHDGPLRRVKVKPHHIGDIFLKHRIVLIPEPMRRVRFQPRFRPFGGKSIRQIDF